MPHPVVSREEWLVARAALLAREKAMMKAQDALAVEQRALPWVEIEENYLFDGPSGTLTFRALFDGRSQLFVHHFMISPDDLGLCVGCSFELDHVQGILEHLNAHDIDLHRGRADPRCGHRGDSQPNGLAHPMGVIARL